ncbi:MAG: N-acetylmuramoyl-L-alanine amidase [Bacilli bacterium]|nr:N-acetylmuramoyl-L-alanine amidase [Bacilli bacterium]
MKKYKIYVLFLILFIFLSLNIIKASNNKLPLFGKVIYLDPGHGGLDPGAMYGGIKEKDINLELSKRLEDRLIKMGAIVYLTRNGDYDLSSIYTNNRKRSDLSRRTNMINKSNCDMFLSIHLNAEDTNTWRGAQVFYDDINKENKKIANIFQTQFKRSLVSKRKIKKVNDLYLQKRIKRPGVLLEVGFLSNANERYLLKTKTYQEKIVNTIVNSLLIYFNDV